MATKKSFNNFKLSMLSLACMSAMSAVQADTIDGIQGTDVGTQSAPVTSYDFTSLKQFGYGGWNLDNVTVNIINAETGDAVAKSFDETTCSGKVKLAT
ncbi:hypothetical protein GHNINEIG_01216 [Hydrogenovibrio crunogenus]|uniref:Uncharacterized protein n=1 Tax=Hydrogenovibrio crunogenus TaxID=39765 RepID=A0A4P7P1P7_9GAMM|nr:hypothetical protein [Hydrogenovibrio crunogenus]QBZ83172.1 hypothetical protein GHNINEIG_01216 [Hydrogenovibrio crunogenus]